MKKVLSIAMASVLLFSCTKEQVKECNCGLIVSDDASDYSVVIRNSCSGNERRFVLQPGDWIDAGVGENYCITNITSW